MDLRSAHFILNQQSYTSVLIKTFKVMSLLEKPLFYCLIRIKIIEAISIRNKIFYLKGSFSGNGVVTIGTQEKI